MHLLLGVDLGTTNTKVVAYSTTGQPVAQASSPTPTSVEGMRQASHDPELLWQACAQAIRQTVAQLPAEGRIEGLALASIGESGVPLDAHGQPVYPIIAWYDERTLPQTAQLAQRTTESALYRISGLPLGHTFTLNKLLWLQECQPEAFARLRTWLCVSDYIAYRLTGERCMGYSLASRTLAFDLRRLVWSQELLSLADLDAAIFPPLQPEGTRIGQVGGEAARWTGLQEGTPVYVGGHDHVCGALAMGAFEPGRVLDSTGTTEAELATLTNIDDHLDTADTSFCLGCHVARGRYYALGSILGAGSMLAWLADLLWPDGQWNGAQALQALTDAAASSPRGAQGLYVLPHLAGAGSPERHSSARGVFVGLSLSQSRADLARAALEGLAYELRWLWEALERFSGHPIEQVITAGGGARNAFWSQIKSDVTGRALTIPQHTEAAALGAALLAGIGAGVYHDARDAHRQIKVPVAKVHPQPEAAEDYAIRYHALMAQVRPLAAELGRRSGQL
ncbi:MAG: FGGY-family carbohydrate kinase [Anaerolineae bacterium]